MTAPAADRSGRTVDGRHLRRRARDHRLLADLRTELVTPHDFRLLPGPHKMRLHDQRAGSFTVDRTGTVGYDSILDPVLDGRGTGTLSFR